jgi:hypothetical protein
LQLVFHRLADPVDGEAAAAELAIRKFCVKEGVDLRDLQILPSDDHRLEWLQDIIAVRKRYRAHMDQWQKMEREHIRTIDDLRTQLNEAQATIDQSTAGGATRLRGRMVQMRRLVHMVQIICTISALSNWKPS